MNEYYEYFGPNYRLDVPQNNTEDLNTAEYLDKVKTQVFENLRHTGGGGGAPSVQMQREWSLLIRLLIGVRCSMHAVSKLTATASGTFAAIPRTPLDEDDDVDEDERDPNVRRHREFLVFSWSWFTVQGGASEHAPTEEKLRSITRALRNCN